MNPQELPLVTIVTPSYNMARYLRYTIDSIFAQDYPRIEYIVVDGGSTDDTAEVVRAHGDRIRFITGKDKGPSDAAHRGFQQAHGEIFAWLNADDAYLPGAVRTAVEYLMAHPEVDVVYGEGNWIDESGAVIRRYPTLPFDPKMLERDCFICQPSAFIRASAYRHCGLDPDINRSFDYDLWIRMAKQGMRFAAIPQYLSCSRMHQGAKTIYEREPVFLASMDLLQRHYGYVPFSWAFGFAAYKIDGRDQFFKPLQPSLRKYLATLPLGLKLNPGKRARFFAEWFGVGLAAAWRLLPMLLLLSMAACARHPAPRVESPAYAPAGSCRTCHAAIAESYQHVAMARSLYRPTPSNVIEDYQRNNHFFHRPSNRHYRMVERGGRYYQQRYQLDAGGREINLLEQEITYIIGSGNHARSYLHLSESGELTEMPISWYTGEVRWAMSPGYDRPAHLDFSRRIDHNCMFCHNAYPDLPAGADHYGADPRFPRRLPEGIDCQRCHGPGSRHIELASQAGSKPEAIRAAIVNPARLLPERAMDVCQQCHLEITSARLPQAVARFNRPVYSFRPGEPLGGYLVHFDHPKGTGHEDKFEIVSAAYRLRQSQCFLKSGGKLTCITCHNPHRTPSGEQAVTQFRAACMSCHPQVAPPHPALAASDCAGCHMPKRRTEDVVHVAVTDHLIARPKPGRDLLVSIAETDPTYRGDLVLYDPPQLPDPDRDLYLGIAMVKDSADLDRGIPLLEKAIAASGKSAPTEAFVELAVAYGRKHNDSAAAENYRKALALNPRLTMARYDLGRTLADTGDTTGARAQFEQALRDNPDLPEAHNNLAALFAQSGEADKAIQEYQSAIRLRADFAEAHNNLSRLYVAQGRATEAQAEVEEALRDDPDYAPAYTSFGILMANRGRLDLAVGYFERAAGLDPDSADAHYNYGRALHAQEKRPAAITEYRRTLQLDPNLAPAHLSLGVALAEGGQAEAAKAEFREALRLRPGYPDAIRNLQLLTQ